MFKNKVFRGDIMKKLYTIGETAELLGVTTQTLRYYDKIGLLSPICADKKTGYRYYSYTQFHYIDRIKYLQTFGMSLVDIEDIIHSGSVDKLLPYLREKKNQSEKELENLKKRINDIEWYIDYFTYLDKDKNSDYLYKVQIDERYIIKARCYYKEPLPNMEIRLAGVKSRKEYENLSFRRQYGYKINVDAMMKQEFYPMEYFVFLREKPDIDEKLYDTLPAGEYLCFRTQALKENWNPDVLTDYFKNKKKPKLTLALEFEDNLVEYSNAWYEIQILL
jgi:DNA-binding transcriptional MerR regulator